MLLASAAASSGVRKVRGDQHRTENLLARQDRSRLDPGDQGRGIEAAAIREAIVRPPELEPLLGPLAHQPLDALELGGSDDRADVGRLVQGIADPELRHPRPQLRVKCVRDALGRQQARPSAADLPLVEPDRVDDALDRAVDIGVLEHDEGRLAAELERQLLACSRGRLADGAADLGRAGEGDLVDALLGDERRPGRAVSGDDVDDARRQPRLDADFGEGERGQRRIFGGLQNDRVARGERGGDLPGEHEKREVPRDDLPADADRHACPGIRSRPARPSRRDGRSAGRRAECRCRATRGSACRCRSSRAPRGSARASARDGRAHKDASSARSRRAPPISASPCAPLRPPRRHRRPSPASRRRSARRSRG